MPSIEAPNVLCAMDTHERTGAIESNRSANDDRMML